MSSRSRNQFSEQFLEGVRAERTAIAQRVADAERSVNELSSALAVAQSRLSCEQAALSDLDELLGIAPQMPLLVDEGALGGRALREAAVQVLLDEQISAPIHYLDWFERLSLAGYRVRGKNPLATFLTQISRDERVESIGSKSGLYRVAST